MKKLLPLLFLLITSAPMTFADDNVSIDKENCTITKNGESFPLHGDVKIIDLGSSDIVVKVVESGSCDIEVKLIDGGHASCGEWKIIESGTADLTVKIVESGSADIVVKFI